MTDGEARPGAVRALTWLLVATAAATVVVEVLNYRYAPEHGYGFAVRTGWALLRTLGWLILIRHVRRGRSGARAFGLILAVTTVFAVGRLVVPRTGTPPLPGLAGFAVLTALCVTVVVLLYRHPVVRGYLVRHPRRLVFTRDGIGLVETAPKRAPVAGWVLTARVSAFTYSPLILVPCLVAVGELGERPEFLLAVLFWFAAGVAASYAVLLSTIFLLRGRPFGRRLLIWVSVAVLVVDLPLCFLLLGLDGLVRDGAPLVAAVLLTFWSLWRASRSATPAGDAERRAGQAAV
ncbi:hypothetical protein [Jidongwangia harbinensis]|uniref:hypothetical protein n=1 Tax=Jidongwangia harbinensis TaxID=2878561 RepID=UPI001CDA45E1|nr:hypothetical protein [Jidongwangia harbinensis]MCA2218635.1 hypothetical protein [Jidongwangia harbinensis]